MTNKEKYWLVKQAKMKTVELSGEVQGVGLRRTVHNKLHELGVEGVAVNDAKTNKVYLTAPDNVMEEVLDAVRSRIKEKEQEMQAQSWDNRKKKFSPMKVKEVKKDMGVEETTLTPKQVLDFGVGQGMTGLMKLDYPSQAQWLKDRYRLKSNKGNLTGNLSRLARRQLNAQAPVYQGQMLHPEEFGPIAWAKSAKVDKTTPVKIGPKNLQLYVSTSDKDKADGLMNIKNLPDDHGMAFIYKSPGSKGFWMKNTHIPLDIGFFDDSGTLLEVRELEPHDETLVHSSSDKVVMAVELNRGAYEDFGIDVGSKVGSGDLEVD